jgi:hypothetical protein
MLRRIYVDNFLSLVGFDLELRDRQLLLGRNGMGKSSLFRAIRAVRDVVEGGQKCSAVFTADTLTRWQSLRTQQFELDLVLPTAGRIHYVLAVEHADHSPRSVRVIRETVHSDTGPLFEYVDGNVRLYTDDHLLTNEFPLELEHSLLGTLVPGPDRTLITAFRRWLADVCVLRIDSPHMANEARGTDPQSLADDSTDFPNWYRGVVLSDQVLASELRTKLTSVLPGFVSLDLRSSGADAALLSAKFEVGGGQNSDRAKPITFRFDELSDGQRSLIVLYTLLYFALKGGHTLCLDQPDEYVSIEEIQPWLLTALDELDAGAGQLLLISHHPELINVLAPEHGLWFERPSGASTRVRPFAALPNSPLQAAEQIARGENNADA